MHSANALPHFLCFLSQSKGIFGKNGICSILSMYTTFCAFLPYRRKSHYSVRVNILAEGVAQIRDYQCVYMRNIQIFICAAIKAKMQARHTVRMTELFRFSTSLNIHEVMINLYKRESPPGECVPTELPNFITHWMTQMLE